jgi:outer membrane lipoprotein SlyB
MDSQVTKSAQAPHPLIWIAGIAVILFCVAGFAAIMGWIPTSIGSPSEVELAAKKTAPSSTAKAKTAPAQVASSAPVAKCTSCGVIESVREVSEKGEGSGLGAAGGAVAGGLLGHQVGGGSGKQIATVVGAVGGAVAGNEVEKRMKATKSYDVTVRLDDGSSRVINENNPPSWRSGDRVRIVDGAIRSI